MVSSHFVQIGVRTGRKTLPSYFWLVLCADLTRMAILEWKEDWKLLVWLFWQRLLYRQVMYYIAAKSLFAALRGRSVAWGKVERKATIPMGR
jgi:hypothetical protein